MPSKVKNYLIILLAAATVSSSLIAWNQSQRVAALMEERQKTAATTAKPKPAPVAASFTANSEAIPAKSPAEVESAASEETPATPPPRRRNNRPNFGALMGNPEFAKAVSIQQRSALDVRYAALFKQLNLSPAELEKFKDLLVERQTARMDVLTAARENGLNPRENRDEIRKLTEEAQAEVDANIKAALGDARFDQYQNYEATQPQRNLVGQLDQRLSYTSTPLNSTQSEFLVNALATSTPGAVDQAPGGGPGNWGGGGRVLVTDEVIQKAQSVLTPDQVSALKQLQSEQQAQLRIREMLQSNGGDNTSGTQRK